MTIGRKLLFSFGAASVLTLAVSVIAIESIGTVGGAVGRLGRVTAHKRFLASDTGAATNAILAAERGVLVRAYMKDRATMVQYNQDFAKNLARARQRLDELAGLSESEDDRRFVDEARSLLTQVEQGNDEFWNQASSDQIDAAAETYRAKTDPLMKQVVALAGTFTDSQSRRIAEEVGAAEGIVSRTRWIAITMILFAGMVITVASLVVRGINASLRRTLTELMGTSSQVDGTTEHVSSFSRELAQESSDQAASLEETSASTEEINSVAHRNGEHCRSAADVVTQSGERFSEANEMLGAMVGAMEDINRQSANISKIIGTIDEIAFQTNILALNAAVEAARAGEAGMGFAVVADEVRNLAQRCAQAARDTSTLIEESIAKSGDGKKKVDEVATAFQAITTEAARVKTLVTEVAVGSEEQVRGIEQVSQAIHQMEQLTQRTAATAAESATEAEDLRRESETLKQIVARLEIMIGAEAGV